MPERKKRPTAFTRAWTQGAACAAATLMRTHGESSMARDLVKELNLTREECALHGVHENDVEALAPLWED